MHDEASPTYVDMIDQTTLGHRLLKSQFNAVPSSTWQIDPFGHSSVQQSLMTAASGFASVFFGRADYQDRWNRGNQTNLEFIWRTSASQPGLANFAGLIPGYGPPPGLCFDLSCASPTPVQDNPAAEDYNVPFLVNLTVANALAMAPAYKASPDGTVHIMWTMGSDL
jgi:alpha-mannosidase